MTDTDKTMRVFGLRTYCDLAGQRHAKSTLYTLTRAEVMRKHPETKKSLIKMGVVVREEDYDPETHPPVLNDEDAVSE
jgi:glycerol-3-phosphate dehydrogenase